MLSRRCFGALAMLGTAFAGCGAPFDRDSIARSLPADVKLDTIADASPNEKITVEQRLIRLHAHVDADGTLRDSSGGEIRFFHLRTCWGNPPPNYLELQRQEKHELEELSKEFTVVTITCNPSGLPIP
jgi:hypothetical protein